MCWNVFNAITIVKKTLVRRTNLIQIIITIFENLFRIECVRKPEFPNFHIPIPIKTSHVPSMENAHKY